MSSSTASFPRLRNQKERPQSQRKPLEHAGLFLKNFVRHPRMVASAIPSSRYLISRILAHVDWEKTSTIVEYGPGVGTFTGQILARMSPKARLLAIELNPEFCHVLQTSIDDPRFHLVHGSAADVKRWMRTHSMYSADFIMSGIPYVMFARDERRRILNASRNVLSPRGMFATFQYSRMAFPDLKEVFADVRQDFEPINILPARVYYCRTRN